MPQAIKCGVNELDLQDLTPKSGGLPSVIRTHHVVFQWVPLSVTDGPPRMNSATIRKTFCFGFIYPKSVKMKQIKTSYVLGNETWKQSSGKRR